MRAATPVLLMRKTAKALYDVLASRATRAVRAAGSALAGTADDALGNASHARALVSVPTSRSLLSARRNDPLASAQRFPQDTRRLPAPRMLPLRDALGAIVALGLLAALATAAPRAHAQGAPQDPALIAQAAERFLLQQTEGVPGRVTIAVTPPQPQGLAACPNLEAFLPPGVRLWGKAMVGVRCNGERPWTIYVQARVGVIGNYYVASHGLNPNTVIGPNDLMVQNGDLTALPAVIVTDPSQIVGTTTMGSVVAGMPLRTDSVRAAVAINFGQIVKLIAQGNGFAISSEGSALANASAGQQVRVRTSNGAIVSGIAQPDSTVNIPL